MISRAAADAELTRAKLAVAAEARPRAIPPKTAPALPPFEARSANALPALASGRSIKSLIRSPNCRASSPVFFRASPACFDVRVYESAERFWLRSVVSASLLMTCSSRRSSASPRDTDSTISWYLSVAPIYLLAFSNAFSCARRTTATTDNASTQAAGHFEALGP